MNLTLCLFDLAGAELIEGRFGFTNLMSSDKLKDFILMYLNSRSKLTEKCYPTDDLYLKKFIKHMWIESIVKICVVTSY